MHGHKVQLGRVHLDRGTFQENEVTCESCQPTAGGGALFANRAATFLVRDTLFLENKAANGHGHHIMTLRDTALAPSITLINADTTACDDTTLGCGTNGWWNYYEINGTMNSSSVLSYAMHTPTTTCDSIQCDDTGFLICTPRPNPNQGVICAPAVTYTPLGGALLSIASNLVLRSRDSHNSLCNGTCDTLRDYARRSFRPQKHVRRVIRTWRPYWHCIQGKRGRKTGGRQDQDPNSIHNDMFR